MTYRKLAQMILALSDEQKEEDVRYFNRTEGFYFRLGALSFVEDDNDPNLPVGTPYLED